MQIIFWDSVRAAREPIKYREQQGDPGSIDSSKGTQGVQRAARGPLENTEQQGDPWSIESSKGTLGV